MNIGKAIRHARIKREMTLADLEEKANLPASYLSLLERGKRDLKLSTLTKISKALDLPLFLLIFSAELIDEDIEKVIGMELAEKLAYELLKLPLDK